jgi:DNA gyrase/topoisomerase IV subunit A
MFRVLGVDVLFEYVVAFVSFYAPQIASGTSPGVRRAVRWSLSNILTNATIDITTDERNGNVVATAPVGSADSGSFVSASSQVITVESDEISRRGRNTMGVNIIEFESGNELATIKIDTLS